jgi:DNA-directed RNA polymerase subunit beta'
MEKIFLNQTLDKNTTKKLLSWFLDNYSELRLAYFLDEMKSVGFHFATKAGFSLGFDDLRIPDGKERVLKQAELETFECENDFTHAKINSATRYQRLMAVWASASESLKDEVTEYFEETDFLNPLYMMAFSGARGNISQVRQLIGMRGLMSDSSGGVIDFPIRSNFREGLSVTEYAISCYGARKGLIDTALRTADSGYLTRRLVDVAQKLVIGRTDCGTNEYFLMHDLRNEERCDPEALLIPAEDRVLGRLLGETLYFQDEPISTHQPYHPYAHPTDPSWQTLRQPEGPAGNESQELDLRSEGSGWQRQDRQWPPMPSASRSNHDVMQAASPQKPTSLASVNEVDQGTGAKNPKDPLSSPGVNRREPISFPAGSTFVEKTRKFSKISGKPSPRWFSTTFFKIHKVSDPTRLPKVHEPIVQVSKRFLPRDVFIFSPQGRLEEPERSASSRRFLKTTRTLSFHRFSNPLLLTLIDYESRVKKDEKRPHAKETMKPGGQLGKLVSPAQLAGANEVGSRTDSAGFVPALDSLNPKPVDGLGSFISAEEIWPDQFLSRPQQGGEALPDEAPKQLQTFGRFAECNPALPRPVGPGLLILRPIENMVLEGAGDPNEPFGSEPFGFNEVNESLTEFRAAAVQSAVDTGRAGFEGSTPPHESGNGSRQGANEIGFHGMLSSIPKSARRYLNAAIGETSVKFSGGVVREKKYSFGGSLSPSDSFLSPTDFLVKDSVERTSLGTYGHSQQMTNESQPTSLAAKQDLGRLASSASDGSCWQADEEEENLQVYLLGVKNEEILPDLLEKVSDYREPDQGIPVRSALTCRPKSVDWNIGKNDDICQYCYGWNLATGRLVFIGEAVGILAAQSIGEPGTQLTMRTFHTGGVFSAEVEAKVFAPHGGFVSFSRKMPFPQFTTALGQKAFFITEELQIKISQNEVNEPTALAGVDQHPTESTGPFKPDLSGPAADSVATYPNFIQTYNEQSILENFQKTQGKKLSSILELPPYSYVFVFPGQKIERNQVCAEISKNSGIPRKAAETFTKSKPVRLEIQGQIGRPEEEVRILQNAEKKWLQHAERSEQDPTEEADSPAKDGTTANEVGIEPASLASGTKFPVGLKGPVGKMGTPEIGFYEDYIWVFSGKPVSYPTLAQSCDYISPEIGLQDIGSLELKAALWTSSSEKNQKTEFSQLPWLDKPAALSAQTNFAPAAVESSKQPGSTWPSAGLGAYGHGEALPLKTAQEVGASREVEITQRNWERSTLISLEESENANFSSFLAYFGSSKKPFFVPNQKQLTKFPSQQSSKLNSAKANQAVKERPSLPAFLSKKQSKERTKLAGKKRAAETGLLQRWTEPTAPAGGKSSSGQLASVQPAPVLRPLPGSSAALNLPGKADKRKRSPAVSKRTESVRFPAAVDVDPTGFQTSVREHLCKLGELWFGSKRDFKPASLVSPENEIEASEKLRSSAAGGDPTASAPAAGSVTCPEVRSVLASPAPLGSLPDWLFDSIEFENQFQRLLFFFETESIAVNEDQPTGLEPAFLSCHSVFLRLTGDSLKPFSYLFWKDLGYCLQQKKISKKNAFFLNGIFTKTLLFGVKNFPQFRSSFGELWVEPTDMNFGEVKLGLFGHQKSREPLQHERWNYSLFDRWNKYYWRKSIQLFWPQKKYADVDPFFITNPLHGLPNLVGNSSGQLGSASLTVSEFDPNEAWRATKLTNIVGSGKGSWFQFLLGLNPDFRNRLLFEIEAKVGQEALPPAMQRVKLADDSPGMVKPAEGHVGCSAASQEHPTSAERAGHEVNTAIHEVDQQHLTGQQSKWPSAGLGQPTNLALVGSFTVSQAASGFPQTATPEILQGLRALWAWKLFKNEEYAALKAKIEAEQAKSPSQESGDEVGSAKRSTKESQPTSLSARRDAGSAFEGSSGLADESEALEPVGSPDDADDANEIDNLAPIQLEQPSNFLETLFNNPGQLEEPASKVPRKPQAGGDAGTDPTHPKVPFGQAGSRDRRSPTNTGSSENEVPNEIFKIKSPKGFNEKPFEFHGKIGNHQNTIIDWEFRKWMVGGFTLFESEGPNDSNCWQKTRDLKSRPQNSWSFAKKLHQRGWSHTMVEAYVSRDPFLFDKAVTVESVPQTGWEIPKKVELKVYDPGAAFDQSLDLPLSIGEEPASPATSQTGGSLLPSMAANSYKDARNWKQPTDSNGPAPETNEAGSVTAAGKAGEASSCKPAFPGLLEDATFLVPEELKNNDFVHNNFIPHSSNLLDENEDTPVLPTWLTDLPVKKLKFSPSAAQKEFFLAVDLGETTRPFQRKTDRDQTRGEAASSRLGSRSRKALMAPHGGEILEPDQWSESGDITLREVEFFERKMANQPVFGEIGEIHTRTEFNPPDRAGRFADSEPEEPDSTSASELEGPPELLISHRHNFSRSKDSQIPEYNFVQLNDLRLWDVPGNLAWIKPLKWEKPTSGAGKLKRKLVGSQRPGLSPVKPEISRDRRLNWTKLPSIQKKLEKGLFDPLVFGRSLGELTVAGIPFQGSATDRTAGSGLMGPGSSVRSFNAISFDKSNQILRRTWLAKSYSLTYTLRLLHPYRTDFSRGNFELREKSLEVREGEILKSQEFLFSQSYQESRTGDIVQGLPKIEQLFEARRSSPFTLVTLHQELKKQFTYFCEKFPPLHAARLSLRFIQRVLVDEIQLIYHEQGVEIHDKHVELIVRQMTRRVAIRDAGTTHFLPSSVVEIEILERYAVSRKNKLNHYQKYSSNLADTGLVIEPVILGLTKTSLVTTNFLSAASFQEARRMLFAAATKSSVDFLSELKHDVLVGRYLRAGSTFHGNTRLSSLQKRPG